MELGRVPQQSGGTIGVSIKRGQESLQEASKK